MKFLNKNKFKFCFLKFNFAKTLFVKILNFKIYFLESTCSCKLTDVPNKFSFNKCCIVIGSALVNAFAVVSPAICAPSIAAHAPNSTAFVKAAAKDSQ